MPLPAGYHVQSVDVADVAARLLRAIDDGPQGLLPDYGGPERLTVREAARLWKKARGVRKPIVPFPGVWRHGGGVPGWAQHASGRYIRQRIAAA